MPNTTPAEGDNKRKPTEDVKSLIVGMPIHQRLKNFCKENGLTIRPWVEKALTEALEARESRK